nr:MAG TPA: hypothetical protein [Caudoviricetes sp.]
MGVPRTRDAFCSAAAASSSWRSAYMSRSQYSVCKGFITPPPCGGPPPRWQRSCWVGFGVRARREPRPRAPAPSQHDASIQRLGPPGFGQSVRALMRRMDSSRSSFETGFYGWH